MAWMNSFGLGMCRWHPIFAKIYINDLYEQMTSFGRNHFCDTKTNEHESPMAQTGLQRLCSKKAECTKVSWVITVFENKITYSLP